MSLYNFFFAGIYTKYIECELKLQQRNGKDNDCFNFGYTYKHLFNLSKLSERGKHVYHKNPLKLDPRPTYNTTAIHDPANPLLASTIVIQWCGD